MKECFCACVVGMTPHMMPRSFQRDALGRCKMCKGWRRDALTYLSLREVFSSELPAALHNGVLPVMVFKGLRLQGEWTIAGPTPWARIHRDDINTLVTRCRIALQTRPAYKPED